VTQIPFVVKPHVFAPPGIESIATNFIFKSAKVGV
jgi:hypothetical protein